MQSVDADTIAVNGKFAGTLRIGDLAFPAAGSSDGYYLELDVDALFVTAAR